MSLRQISKAVSESTIFLVLCLVLLAACGSSTGSSSGASATATACAKVAPSANSLRVTIGTLKSINAKALVLTDTQGKNTTITYSNTTTFTQEARITASALQEGTLVSVVVMSTGNTYTAVSVTTGNGVEKSTSGGPGPGGAPATKGTPIIINGGPGSSSDSNGGPAINTSNKGNSGPCAAPTGGSKNIPSGTPNTNSHALLGTVSQVNGTILTISDPAGASYTVTLTAQTQIIGTQKASATALKVGEPLTVVGKSGSQNTIAANTIEILLSLHNHPSAPLA